MKFPAVTFCPIFKDFWYITKKRIIDLQSTPKLIIYKQYTWTSFTRVIVTLKLHYFTFFWKLTYQNDPGYRKLRQQPHCSQRDSIIISLAYVISDKIFYFHCAAYTFSSEKLWENACAIFIPSLHLKIWHIVEVDLPFWN